MMTGPAAQPQKYKRKKYLIHRKFQLEYVRLILLLVILTATVCSYVVYYTSMVTLGPKLAAVYPQGRLVSIVNAVNWRILITMALITPIIIVMGIYTSHKIAGPAFRIERTLKNMSNGDLTEHIRLRRGDELVSLADSVNSVRSHIVAMINGQRANLDMIYKELDGIRGIAASHIKGDGTIGDRVDRLDDVIRRMKSELEKYKIEK